MATVTFTVAILQQLELALFAAAGWVGCRTVGTETAIFNSPRLSTIRAVLVVSKQVVQPVSGFYPLEFVC
jgi:hypothetical protein